jgi:hypothetical protein
VANFFADQSLCHDLTFASHEQNSLGEKWA